MDFLQYKSISAMDNKKLQLSASKEALRE